MRLSVYAYNDSPALTRNLLGLLASPSSHGCEELDISANSGLEAEACTALVNSEAAKTIRSLSFTEIYFSPEQLAQMLTMPQLVSMSICGGESYDWAGPSYIYGTLEMDHIQVLLTDPNAKKLRSLDLTKQRFSEGIIKDLQEAIPNLQSVWV